MARRVVVDADRPVNTYSESTTERPPVASVITRVLTAVYAFVISMIALDSLFRAMDARESNGFVEGVRDIAGALTAPFRGMFDNQNWGATALAAAVVYTVVYVVAMTIMRRDRTY